MADISTVQMAVREIERYANQLIELIEPLSENQLWSKGCGIPNSIGTLARHLTGNLNHYFGAGILKNGYVRERDKEFTETGLSKAQVLSDLRNAVNVAKAAVEVIDVAQIDKPYRSPCGEKYESLAYHAIRLATHLALHVGQADYATRCVR
ncbi:MAG: DinB family protein [Anaerolineae bacterium]|nr:DinB family protein [Anaerolineae bacterium]